MRVGLIADDRKPPRFQDRAYYLLSFNADPIRVGDTIAPGCDPNHRARILEIWLTFSQYGPHLALEETEAGHKHILKLDHGLAEVSEDKTIDLLVIRTDDNGPRP